MNILTQFNPILQALFTFGVLLAGLGYSYEKFFGGRTKQASEQSVTNTTLIEGLQAQVNGLETLVERQRKEHKMEMDVVRSDNTRLTGQVGELRGQLTAKDGKIAEYEKIFKGYNPKIDESLARIADFMGGMKPIMEKISTHFDGEHQ